MNVLDFAMQMEEDGRAYYEKLAKETSSPGLETIFNNLAEDEQKHFEIFKRLREGDKVEYRESQVLAGAKGVFSRLEPPAFPGADQSVAAYRHAMQLEAESFRLYQDAAGKEENPELRSLLQKIAAEELKHFNVLENICLFLEEPAQHPAWAEATDLSDIRQFGVSDGK